ncbi:MAG: TlpA family protein disulfide reductase [Bacteroidales bacterium]|nr:TlpA family protein disulfide reductase [Bacteroidales bacterium]
MKKLLILAVAAIAALSCTEKKAGYTVTVNTEDESFTSFILTNRDKENPIADTVAVVDKKAVFKGSVEGFDIRSIMGVKEGEEPVNITRFFLENAEYTISFTPDGNHYHAEIVSNGPIQMEKDSLEKLVEAAYGDTDMDGLYQEYMAGDNKLKDSIWAIVQPLLEKGQEVEKEYYANNPLSVLTMEELYSAIRYSQIDLDSSKKVYERFAAVPEFANTTLMKNMKKEVEKREALSPGHQAPDFTLNDPDGNPVTFSEVYPKNKVTMIDFWASWCGPCRRFNPTLIQIYAKYNKKGFGIIGVSLDSEKDKWVEAIKKDKLVWQHVSDLQYWNSEAGKLYNISSIPQSYFVDSEGKILLASPSEEQIESFLEEYLK